MKLPLAYYTEACLRRKVDRIEHIDDQLRGLIDDMIETMHAHNGIGLAAPQIFKSIALFVTCVPIQKTNNEWIPGKNRVYINPQVLSQSQEIQVFSEGCLSIPHINVKVSRPLSIKIQATNIFGEGFEETFVGFEAVNFMHEYDHLQGILIIDYLSIKEREALEKLFKAANNLSKLRD